MEIKGVKIGDRFKKRNPNDNRAYEVVDINKVVSLSDDEVVRYECVAKTEVVDQVVKSKVPFSTVKLGKINN